MTQIMVALDVQSPGDARQIIRQLPHVVWWEIGMELASHPDGVLFVLDLVAEPSSVFLDLKLSDIRPTVGRAVESIVRHVGPAYLSVRTGLAEAMSAADGSCTTIVHVPHLTSDLAATASRSSAKAIVSRAELAASWRHLNPGVDLIVPGICRGRARMIT